MEEQNIISQKLFRWLLQQNRKYKYKAQGFKLETLINVIFIHFHSLFFIFVFFSSFLQISIFKNALFNYVFAFKR